MPLPRFTACCRFDTRSFLKILLLWNLTVPAFRPIRSAISSLLMPSAIRRSTFFSVSVNVS